MYNMTQRHWLPCPVPSGGSQNNQGSGFKFSLISVKFIMNNTSLIHNFSIAKNIPVEN